MCLLATILVLGFQKQQSIGVFPIVEKTGERDPAFSQKLTSESRSYLIKKLEKCYSVVNTEIIDKSLAAEKFDGSDRDNWTTPNLLRLGKRMHLDKAVFAVIGESFNGSSDTFFSIGGGATGTAVVRIWYLDMQANKPIIKGLRFEGKSSSGAFGEYTGSKGRIFRAVQIALDKAFDENLKSSTKGSE